uniref:Uncharacterized protein n=1 Tax=Panagrolaimus sp. JU765 TaxID=591449 RepID=A0AC34QAV8_9BILA
MSVADTVAAWIQLLAKLSNYSGTVLELTAVVFLIREQTDQRSPLKSAYFVVFIVGSILDASTNVSWVAQGIWYDSSIFIRALTNVIMWYGGIFIGTWNTVLAANRCAAMAFSNLYSRLDSGRYLLATVAFLFLFPIILHSYSLVDLDCRLFQFDARCQAYIIRTQSIVTILNCAQAILALLFCIYGVHKSNFVTGAVNAKGKTSKKAKLQFRLLLQSLLTSLLLILVCILQALAVFFERGTSSFWIIRGSADIVFAVFHYSSLFVFFFASSSFRRGYLRFYKINRIPFIKVGSETESKQSKIPEKSFAPPMIRQTSAAIRVT